MRLAWALRAEPLPVVACFASGRQPATLDRRLQSLGGPRVAGLRLIETVQGTLILGAESALPWMPDLIWLGREPGAAQLLLPTQWQPGLPLEWVEAACVQRVGGACAVIPRVAYAPSRQADAAELLLLATAGARPVLEARPRAAA